MTDGTKEKHGTSDEYVDPYCDICFETKGINVRVYGYCKNCFQFLCSDCYLPHGKFQVTKDHVILRGSSMPQSQADKPPRFHHCDDHPTLVKDQFCCEHKSMLCSSCSSIHAMCIVQSIEDVCKNISPSETDSLYNEVRDLQDRVKSVLLLVETNIKRVKEQRNAMLSNAQTLYDDAILQLNTLYLDTESNIESKCQSQIVLMSQHQTKINAMIAKLESFITDIEKFKGESIDTKLFLKIHENINDTNKIIGEFSSISLIFVDLSFSKSLRFTAPSVMGFVSNSHTKLYTNTVFSDILFPSAPQPHKVTHAVLQHQSHGHISGAAGSQTSPVSQIKASKQCGHNIKIDGDYQNCFITGMSVTKDGRILMADKNNGKVKLFSSSMEFLSSISVAERRWYMFSSDTKPTDIAVINDNEAVITTTNNLLVSLDISGAPMHIKATTKVPYAVIGITKYKNKLFISSDNPIPSVKLIDLTGKVYLSVSSDQQGQSLFDHPLYVTSHDGGGSSTVLVTDWYNHSLTLLNGETGDVITRRQSVHSSPLGVTTDATGNVYLCYEWTHQVSVLSRDLTEQKILVSRKDGLRGDPKAIVYDVKTHRFLISFLDKDSVDSFKPS